MEAVQFKEYGSPEVLEVTDVDQPHAGPGEIRVAVRAAGVNAMDWKVRAGYMREHMPLLLPAGTGQDAAGVVDEVGDGVTDVAVGDAVFGMGTATYAEYAVLRCWAVKSAQMTFAEAAGLPLPVETAFRILRQAGTKPGETILISGAAGGVGTAVIQIACQQGRCCSFPQPPPTGRSGLQWCPSFPDRPSGRRRRGPGIVSGG
jgi:NADPH:quinone reductase-like Zn-dependent oxidoreductase